jgi:hypothetical protein
LVFALPVGDFAAPFILLLLLLLFAFAVLLWLTFADLASFSAFALLLLLAAKLSPLLEEAFLMDGTAFAAISASRSGVRLLTWRWSTYGLVGVFDPVDPDDVELIFLLNPICSVSLYSPCMISADPSLSGGVIPRFLGMDRRSAGHEWVRVLGSGSEDGLTATIVDVAAADISLKFPTIVRSSCH